MKISLKTIADEVGVTAPTVSRVLRNDKTCYISEEKKALIFETCNRYNYKPNAAARGLALGKSFSIAYVSHHFADLEKSGPFMMATLDALADILKRAGYSCPMVTVNNSNDIEELTQETNRYDAIIIARGILTPETANVLKKSNMPHVVLDQDEEYFKGMTRISRDKQAGTDEGIEYLVRQGHQNIALFGFGENLNHFRESCKKFKLPVNNGHIYQFPLVTVYEESVAAYVYSDKLFKNLKKYSAVCCSTDIIALSLCRRLENAGIKLGENISILGFNNIEDIMNIPENEQKLTTVQNCRRELGTVCANTVLKLVDGKVKSGKHITIPCKLKIRNSVADIN